MSPMKCTVIDVLIVGLLLSTTAFATENGTWISLTPTTDGSPPDVQVLETNSDHTILRLEVPGYYTEDIEADAVTYQIPRIPDAGFFGEVGSPELPVITRWVAIPNTGSVDVNVLSETVQDIPGPAVYPLQDLEEEYYPDQSVYKNQDIYARDEVFPSSPVRVSEPMIMRDIRLVAVSWIPIRTNPNLGGITASSSIDVEIRSSNQPGMNEKSRQLTRMTPSFYKIYRSNIINFNELYDEGTPEPGSILIICVNNTEVTTRLQPLVDWKKRKGYAVILATTAQTGSSYSDIKAYIQTAYNTWDPPLEYVILVGDAESGSYDIPVYGGRYDHGYTQLDGTDIIGDVAVGRLSFDDLSTLTNIVNKIVGYESNPYMGQTGWYNRAYLMAGTNHAYSTVVTKRYVRDLLHDTGISGVTIQEYSSSSIPATEMRSNVNAGVLYLNYRGSWVSEMVCSHFHGQLSNGYMLPAAVCITCGTGSFTSGESVSECWLREGSQYTPAGAVACIGTATLGTYTRFNNIMDTGIFYGLFVKELYNYGSALVEGKIQLVQNFPFDQQYQENFSYWNNLMGDPSLECWTGVPRTLSVTYPPQLNVGTNYISVEVDDGTTPLHDALVCVLKDGETFITGYTDDNGELTLPITATSSGVLKLTVTKHDYKPRLVDLNVVAGEFVAPIAWVIDDDNSGLSQGNSDGIANPGETIELSVQLKNWGSTLVQSVVGILSEDDPYLSITQNTANYGDITAGATAWSSTDYVISITGDCPNDHLLDLNIEANTTGRPSYTSMVPIVITGADLEFDHRTLSGVGGNGQFDPGEIGDIAVTLNNIGGFRAANITGTLTSSHALAEVLDSTAIFGTINGSSSGSNLDPFSVDVSYYIFPGQPVTFTVMLNGDGGFSDEIEFEEIIGTPDTNDPTGPDDYGYWAFENVDSDYLKHPIYMWVEVDPNYGGSGTVIPLTDYSEDQDDSEVISLPFPFSYYGRHFSQITVCSNGWIAMGNQGDIINGRNWVIPGAHGPDAMIAPFWDDLVLGSGHVYQYYDAYYHRFVVEWSHVVTWYNNTMETFQVILYDPTYYLTPTGDGEIRFQYQQVQNVTGEYTDIPYATVGIESIDQLDGIQYTYWDDYPSSAAGLTNGRAILFTTDVGDQGSMPDSIGPEISHIPLGNTSDPIGPYEVVATIWDISGVDHADLHYSGNGVSFNTTGMANTSGHDWTGYIPGYPAGTTVYYFFSAVDDSSNYAETDTFSFSVWAVTYSDDFESGAPGWTHHNGGTTWGDQWHISTESANSGTHSWKCGDSGAETYDDFLDAYLESPAIELPDDAEMYFYHRIESEVSTAYPDSAYDGATIEISVNGGQWTQIESESGYNRTIRYSAGGGNPYTGPFSGGTDCWAATINWTEVMVNLNDYQGSCRFRFRFGSDQAVGREGWYIDDFLIIGRPTGPPPVPENLMISLVGNHIFLQWDSSPGALYYTIYYATEPEPANWVSLGTVMEPTTTFQHPNGLNDRQGFYYIVSGN